MMQQIIKKIPRASHNFEEGDLRIARNSLKTFCNSGCERPPPQPQLKFRPLARAILTIFISIFDSSSTNYAPDAVWWG